jgi:hypothetical protein
MLWACVAAVVAVQGAGCGGGGNACSDFVAAVDRAATKPGCGPGLANAMSQAQQIDVATCDDPMQQMQYEAWTSCFNAVMNCTAVPSTLTTLQQCLGHAGASQ